MPRKTNPTSGFANSVRSLENRHLTFWLKTQREQRGLTMREVGKRLNIPHSYISKIEHCDRRLDVVEYVRYCHALEICPIEGLEFMGLPEPINSAA